MNSGVYRILSPTGHYYIGSTKNYTKRWKEHLKKLTTGKHNNTHMQNRYSKYPEGWLFEIVECVSLETKKLLEVEQKYLSACVGKDVLCMNINKSAGNPSRLGIKIPHTQQTKNKISLAHKGMLASAETRTKMSIAHKGKVKTETHRASLSKSCTGRKLSEETKFKKSLALKGKPWSESRRLAHLRKKLQLA